MIRPLLIALLLAAAGPRPSAAGDDLRLVEQEIKAGLLYNFLKYTSWPTTGETIIVCTFAAETFWDALAPMAGRTVNGRAIGLRAIRDWSQARSCSLLFVGEGARRAWPALKAGLAGSAVLTVGDFEGFAAADGMIEFTRAGERIGAKINTDAVASAHLSVQDRLLRLASRAPAAGRVE
jgi:hypothetical protein